MLHNNASHDNDGNGISQVYSINTDGIFMTNPKNQYPNKKDVEFTTDSIGQIFQTDSPAVYFEKINRENFNPDNYINYVGDGAIYYGGAGCGKTYRLCQKALAADYPIILSFTNKAIQNVKSVLFDVYNNYEPTKKCYTFDLFFCDHHGRDITALEGKTIFVDEYSMTPYKWMTKLYQHSLNISSLFTCLAILTSVIPLSHLTCSTIILSQWLFLRCARDGLK